MGSPVGLEAEGRPDRSRAGARGAVSLAMRSWGFCWAGTVLTAWAWYSSWTFDTSSGLRNALLTSFAEVGLIVVLSLYPAAVGSLLALAAGSLWKPRIVPDWVALAAAVTVAAIAAPFLQFPVATTVVPTAVGSIFALISAHLRWPARAAVLIVSFAVVVMTGHLLPVRGVLTF